MNPTLFDSELKIMLLVWESEPISAKDLSLLAKELFGWNKNTTYTVIKKAEAKGYLVREDPGFICRSLISKQDVRKKETKALLQKLFGGSKAALITMLLEEGTLTQAEKDSLRQLLDTPPTEA
ncbi:MAG: BlaI/MecI/CopY family transcriptional regulator [Clostridia bacterium]|nr:BlaI/MecI/CopY family transcriptional regulator [Clostridia bacterium]